MSLELLQHIPNALLRDVVHGIGLVHLVLHVVTRRRGAELQRGRIFLRVLLQLLYLLRTLAGAEYQDSGGKRIQRSCMSRLDAFHALSPRDALAHKGQRAEARHAVWLVDAYYFAFPEIHLVNHYQRMTREQHDDNDASHYDAIYAKGLEAIL